MSEVVILCLSWLLLSVVVCWPIGWLLRPPAGRPPTGHCLEEAVMWARRLKIAYFFLFWLNRAKFDRACECPANGPAWSRTSSMRDVAGICWTMLDHAGHLREFAGHCGTPRPGGRRRRLATPRSNTTTIDNNTTTATTTTTIVIDDRPSRSQRIHHRRPSARVRGSAVMYSRCSTTSPQRFVWRKVAGGRGCFVVTGREASSRTIGIAPRINKFYRIKLIVHYK
jgi:hypothetical protein